MLDWPHFCCGLRLLSNDPIITLMVVQNPRFNFHIQEFECIAPQHLLPDTRNIDIQLLEIFVNYSKLRKWEEVKTGNKVLKVVPDSVSRKKISWLNLMTRIKPIFFHVVCCVLLVVVLTEFHQVISTEFKRGEARQD